MLQINIVIDRLFVALKCLFLTFSCLTAMIWSGSSWAGNCQATNGVMQFLFGFDASLSDPSQNFVGNTIMNAASYNSGETYEASCPCEVTQLYKNFYYTGVSLLPEGHAPGWYAINEYVDIRSYYDISLQGYFQVPFEDQPNWTTNNCRAENGPLIADITTGAAGKIDLYIKKKFVGIVPLSGTVSRLYGVFGTASLPVPTDIPLAEVGFGGYVIAPQSCEINAGQVISVEFGDMRQKDFGLAGAKVAGVADAEKQLSLNCTDIEDGVKLDMRFVAEPSTGQPQSIATDNPDIGVVIEDDQGNIIQPNTGLIPIDMDVTNSTGEVNIRTYPISTTGNTPAAGEFSGMATIRIDFR